MSIDTRLSELGISLPQVAIPAANYVPFVRTGNLIHISGSLPMKDGKLHGVGIVGDSVTTEDAVATARLCGINILAVLRHACDGTLNHVKQCVKLGIFVNAVNGFTDHPNIANGASDLMVDVFGKEIGSHARFAVGAGGLPFNASVEIDALFEVA